MVKRRATDENAGSNETSPESPIIRQLTDNCGTQACCARRACNEQSVLFARYSSTSIKAAQSYFGENLAMKSRYAGSCCALLASVLTELRSGVTIITNSAFIADYIRRSSDFQIILLGGIYQQDARVMVGPMVRQCAENFWVDRFFIGVDGWSARAGFTNQDQMRAQAVRDMARQADRVIVLTESEKFSRHGTVPLNLKDRVRTVITDKDIDAQTTAELESSGIEILTS